MHNRKSSSGLGGKKKLKSGKVGNGKGSGGPRFIRGGTPLQPKYP